MVEQELATRFVIVTLLLQIVYYGIVALEMWNLRIAGELPEYLSSYPIDISLPLYTIVPLAFLLKGNRNEHVRAFLYVAVFIDFAAVIGYWLMNSLFGGNTTPAILMSFLILPAILILFFMRSMEFEPLSYETEQFEIFRMEIESHATIEEGFDYVAGYISEHSDELDDDFFIKLLEYLSQRIDEIGSEARSRLRAENLEDVFDFEETA